MKKYPGVYLTAFFIAGLGISPYFHVPFTAIYYCLMLLAAAAVFFFLFHANQLRLILSLLCYAAVFMLGTVYYTPGPDLPMKSIMNKEEIILYGTIKSINLSGKDELRFFAEGDSLQFGMYTIKNPGNFACVFKGFKPPAFPGNSLCIRGTYLKGRDNRNPGEFNYDDYLRKTGIAGYIYTHNIKDVKIFGGRDEINTRILYARQYIADQIGNLHEKNTSALLTGFLLGDRKDIDNEITTDFINSGTAHVLSVSGLHVAYIIFIFILLSGRFNLYIRFIFTAAGIILFVLLTGFQPAVLRSAVMALAIMTAGITNRSTNIFNSLALSALLILVLDPAELFLPGFQLSYAAVFSIAYLYPVFKQEADKYKFKRNRLKKLILFCGVSVAAQVGTFPFVFYYFSKLSIISVISNLIVVPLTGIILGTVFVTIITAPLVPAAGIIFASANNLFCNFLFKTIEITGNPQFSFIWVRSFTLSDSIVFYLILVSFLCFLKKITSIKKKILYTLLSCASVILFTSLNDSDLLDENYLNCYMIDAGQGDAYLIKFPGGETALIDAGETTENFDTGERIIIPLMNHLDISRIDYAFISHMDADHYSGFVSLLKNGYIKTLYKPPPDTSDRDRRFEKFLKMCNINPVYYNGQIIKTGGGRIYILAHGGMHWNKMTSNDRSQVMIIAYGGKSILFTGDAGIKAENYYIRQFGTLLQSDILKVSHHGSRYATSDEFLSVIKPAYSLISAGEKNKFGHPSEAVLARLKNAGSEVCRTDIEGGVLLRSDGYFINKINWKEK